MTPIEAMSVIPTWLDGREDLADEEHRAYLQKLTAMISAWLDGRGRGADDDGDLARTVAERRISACLRHEGQTWLSLAKYDPKRFQRWAEGTSRAIRRELLVKGGHVSRGHLEQLWNDELRQRAGWIR